MPSNSHQLVIKSALPGLSMNKGRDKSRSQGNSQLRSTGKTLLSLPVLQSERSVLVQSRAAFPSITSMKVPDPRGLSNDHGSVEIIISLKIKWSWIRWRPGHRFCGAQRVISLDGLWMRHKEHPGITEPNKMEIIREKR